MSRVIHPTAIIEEGAEIGENVQIGAYCLIGPHVRIGNGTIIKSHCVIEGHTTIGENNMIHQFASIGVPPQDKSYKDEPTQTIIGDNNLIREGFQMHRATMKENQVTKLGSHNYLMSSVHIAHDCILGDNITMASGCACAGHVKVGDFTQMGGQCGITPFVTVGKGAFIGGASAIDRDVPHYCTALGNRIRLKGVNIIGLKRRGYSKQEVSDVVDFFRMMEASALSPSLLLITKKT
jgi:UDP-N-acetylglucosamine acyltransferase